jgi:hypothetical protein
MDDQFVYKIKKDQGKNVSEASILSFSFPFAAQDSASLTQSHNHTPSDVHQRDSGRRCSEQLCRVHAAALVASGLRPTDGTAHTHTSESPQERVGFLYGTFTDDGGVMVNAIYEPPQSSHATGFELEEDPRAEQVSPLFARVPVASRRSTATG